MIAARCYVNFYFQGSHCTQSKCWKKFDFQLVWVGARTDEKIGESRDAAYCFLLELYSLSINPILNLNVQFVN